MKKLIRGIVEFRSKHLDEFRKKFSQLALGQSPDTLFITCSDSRVAPNWFASTDPGDLFVIRNVGNLVSNAGSEAAAIEFALMNLNVSNIIVCGHSDCGAMHALLRGRDQVTAPHLREWLRHGELSLSRLAENQQGFSPVNALSQQNVLEQLEHLRSYHVVQERLANKTLKLHGWWFELSTGNVFAHDDSLKKFVVIDEAWAKKALSADGV